MTKQEKIQKSYGKHWETVKDYVNEDGWCMRRKGISFDEISKSMKIEMKAINSYNWRPIGLYGIEENNGWVKIETQQDYPKEKGVYFFRLGFINGFRTFIKRVEDLNFIEKTQITHYQLIQKPQPPIY